MQNQPNLGEAAATVVVSGMSNKTGKLALQNPHHDPITQKDLLVSLEVYYELINIH